MPSITISQSTEGQTTKDSTPGRDWDADYEHLVTVEDHRSTSGGRRSTRHPRVNAENYN